MKILRLALAAALVGGLAVASRAIELSLEENRAERGNIGYIDMQKLFRQFPETIRAKENFEEVVRQTEDQINLRKVELLKDRNDLSQLRMERELMAKTTPMTIGQDGGAEPAPKPKAAETPKPQPEAPATGAPPSPVPTPTPGPAQTQTQGTPEQKAEAARAADAAAMQASEKDVSALPGFGPGTLGEKAEKKPEQLVINIPGVSTAPIVVQPPVVSSTPAPAPMAAAIATPAPIKPVQETPAAAAAAPPKSQALAELDAKIALKTRELEQKEADFKRYEAEQEKNLLDLESRKTELLLGKIHRAVQEVARREGVSVVVDKTSILYGHDAVDLTEKVLRFMRTGT